MPIDQRYSDTKPVFSVISAILEPKTLTPGRTGDLTPGVWFPHFVEVKICNEPSPVGNRCLKIHLNAAAAVAYSPVVEISPRFSDRKFGKNDAKNGNFV